MPTKRNIRLFCLSLLLAATGAASSQAAAPSRTIEAKIALEASLEKRLLAVLQKALGTDDVIVIVKADLYAVEEVQKEIMPGVPVKETPATQDDSIPLTMLKSLSAVVIVDEGISQKDLALIERTAEDILGLKKSRGDKLSIEKLSMKRAPAAGTPAQGSPAAPEKEALRGDFFRPEIIVSLLWLFAVVGGLLLVYLSFTRPFLSLAKDALNAWSSSKDRPERPEAAAPVPALAAPHLHSNGNGNGNGNGHKGKDAEDLPFVFISEKHIPMLLHMMKRMTPRTIALITHYLAPRFAAQVLVGLKPDRRREVVRYMSRVTELQEGEVKTIEANVKRKVNYLMGGEDKLASILEEIPAGLQEEMLGTLADKDPELGRRLGRRIVTLEDLGALEPEDVKTLTRQVQLKSIAAVLKGDEELQQRLLPRLTSGLGQWLNQEIELSQPLPPAVLASEQKLVVGALARLVHEGSIVLRRDEDIDGGMGSLYGDDAPQGLETEPEEEGPSFESQMEALPAEPARPPVPAAEPAPSEPPKETPLPAEADIQLGRPAEESYPEIESPTQDLGLRPLDPGADLLPEAPPEPPAPPPSAESERKPERRPKRRPEA